MPDRKSSYRSQIEWIERNLRAYHDYLNVATHTKSRLEDLLKSIDQTSTWNNSIRARINAAIGECGNQIGLIKFRIEQEEGIKRNLEHNEMIDKFQKANR